MDGTRSVAEAEKNFAAASREKGMGTAALETFAEEATSFGPAPINGRKFWTAHLNDPEVLIWKPTFAACSHGGDLGYTTGPWELQKNRADPTPLAFGDYVTIWKLAADAKWKVALDIGVTHAAPTQPETAIELSTFDPGSADHDPDLTKRALLKSQRSFLESAKKDCGQAILFTAANEIRILRPGSLPAVGLVAARLLLSADHAKEVRKFSGSSMSRSGDLTYTFGEFTALRGETKGQGYYLMIWKLDLNGDWKLVLDLEKRGPS